MLAMIGEEQWDFVDAEGEQIILPPADAETMGEIPRSFVRAQLIRITADGPVTTT